MTAAMLRTALNLGCFLTLGMSAVQAADMFGQDIPAELEQTVDLARQMRLPGNPQFSPSDAVAKLEAVVTQKPDYYRALFNLALAQWTLQSPSPDSQAYNKVKALFDKAIDIRDKEKIPDITIFNSAGWVSLKAGDYASAEKYLKRGLEDSKLGNDDTVGMLNNNLGLTYFVTQKIPDAVKYLTIARDTFGSTQAPKTLKLIEDTLASGSVTPGTPK